MLYAILFGLNMVDPNCYPMDIPVVSDALKPLDGSAAVQQLGDVFVTFYGANVRAVEARSSCVISAFTDLAGILRPGDVVACGFAGHGLFLRTTNEDSLRFANRGLGTLAHDRHWTTAMVLEDRLMLADEYNRLLAMFPKRITVLNIIESCAAGAMLWENLSLSLENPKAMGPSATPNNGRPGLGATLSPSENGDLLVKSIYDRNKQFYDDVLQAGPGNLRIAGIQFAASSADEGTYGGIGAPFSHAIATAIRYNDITSYKDLAQVTKRNIINPESAKPVVYAFGKASQSLLDVPLFDPNPRLRPPEPAPDAVDIETRSL